jgi:glycosyltransferase involved in cell wall biosynthesis
LLASIVTDQSIKPVRVLHLVSSGGVMGPAQQALFMPTLTRMPKARAKMLVVALAPNAIPAAVLRQNGIPVYDIALSTQRFSLGAFSQLLKTVRSFRPDIVQAWGYTANIVSHWLRRQCEWDPKIVWSIANTTPPSRNIGMLDRQKLRLATKLAKRADRIVYTSEAAASAHRRIGFPEDGHAVIPLGVDPTRFKPDLAARRKTREQLELEHDAIVIGMLAPFQPEYDYATFLKAIGELIKTNPKVQVLLAGHGVQKGNAPLMALVGGGTLGTRTRLLGEWSDVSSFFNACDIACSTALTDTGRMSLVTAMLCGVPCVGTGIGAQGEAIGQFGVAIEPGSSVALIRGITRILEMPQDRRTFMVQSARNHALTNFVSIRSLQKYLQLYYDLVGRKLEVSTAVPAPKVDATIPVPAPPEIQPSAEKPKPKTNRSVDMFDLRDPDSLESRDAPAAQAPTLKPNEADVLQVFEASLAKQQTTGASPTTERARGVAEDVGDLLAPEVLQGTNDGSAVAITSAETVPSSSITGAAASAVAPPPAKNEIAAVSAASTAEESSLALVDTTIVSMKVSLDATGTLEIPPELIFTTAPVPKTATPAATTANAAETKSAASSNPAAAPAPQVAKTVQTKLQTADSSTVPALAVDELLTRAEGASPASSDEGVQLDLLGDSSTDLKVAGR